MYKWTNNVLSDSREKAQEALSQGRNAPGWQPTKLGKQDGAAGGTKPTTFGFGRQSIELQPRRDNFEEPQKIIFHSVAREKQCN